ncbi:MAG TPA: cytochrome P450 [Bryobacteraceae bacterium]|nr:cytochrome P450 [Bryobacteraceae bacterium]
MSDAINPAVSYPIPGALPSLTTVPQARFLDTLAILFGVFLPTIAKGVIIRRPTMLAIADRLDLDRRAIRGMQRLRREYGSGPVLLRIPGRSLAVVLDPEDVHRILAESPDPFATATPEKTAALAHFEPKMALISRGPERADRRRYNEQVLEAHRPMHHMAEHFVEVVASEARHLRASLPQQHNTLDWNDFSDAWFRIVRRVIFGEAARDDHELSSIMAKLRFAANWAFLRPQRRNLREQLLARIRSYLAKAEPNSLAGMMAHIPATSLTAPEQQLPQWLFAFDPAGMTTFRSLALLASHPEQASMARQEINTGSGPEPHQMPYLRATVLESLRLWPTSPLILRETTGATVWRNGAIPPDTGLVIFTPFFHRDNERLPWADSFSPELWINEKPDPQTCALVPFSEGPAVCPGRHLVLLLTTAMLAELLADTQVRLKTPTRLTAGQPLPATLNHYKLRFELT